MGLGDNAVCGTTCVDTNTDINHCGGCLPGNDCTQNPNYTTPACCGGACTDLNSDPNNCGGCTGFPNDHQCLDLLTVSSQKFAACCNGTCIDTSSSTANCGACGQSCTTGWSCVNGTCCLATGLACLSNSSCCNGTCVGSSIGHGGLCN